MGSWVARGTCYEALSALVLQPFGLLLRMRGGPGDRGVDLQGIWSLPASVHAAATNVAVVAQCKNNEESQVGSAAVRDLASSVLLARERELQTSKQRSLAPQPVCGLFFSQTGFSKEAIRLAFQSEAPLLLAHLTCAFPPPREAAKAGRASKDGSDLPRSPITDAPAASPRTAKAIFSGLTPNRSFAVAFPQIAFAPLLPSSALAQQPNGGNGGGSSTGSGSTVLCNVPFEDSTLTVELQYRVRPLLR